MRQALLAVTEKRELKKHSLASEIRCPSISVPLLIDIHHIEQDGSLSDVLLSSKCYCSWKLRRDDIFCKQFLLHCHFGHRNNPKHLMFSSLLKERYH